MTPETERLDDLMARADAADAEELREMIVELIRVSKAHEKRIRHLEKQTRTPLIPR